MDAGQQLDRRHAVVRGAVALVEEASRAGETGKTQVFNAGPPFNVLTTLDTGPITNHVNIVRNAHGQSANVTVGGLNEVKVFRTDTFEQVATIPVGDLPRIWPSGDGARVYVGLENADRFVAIDTLTNQVIAGSPIGQGAKAIAYVPDAVPIGPGTANLEPLGVAGTAAHLWLAPPGAAGKPPTSVALDQGLIQMLEASVTGLQPKQAYVLSLAINPTGRVPCWVCPASSPTRPAPPSSTRWVRSGRSSRPAPLKSAAISLSRRKRPARRRCKLKPCPKRPSLLGRRVARTWPGWVGLATRFRASRLTSPRL